MKLGKEIRTATKYFLVTFLKWMVPILVMIILILFTNYLISFLT